MPKTYEPRHRRPLFTREQLESIPAHCSGSLKPKAEQIAVFKVMCPLIDWVWWICEYDPVHAVFYGRVDGFESEWGSFSLAELEGVRVRVRGVVEVDVSWKPGPLPKVAPLAERCATWPEEWNDDTA